MGGAVGTGAGDQGDVAVAEREQVVGRFGGTIVILMGVKALPGISAGLIARGMDPHTPAAVVANAGLPGQAVIRGTLASLPEESTAAGVQPPALTIIGAVTALDLPLPD